jgi:guanylate kinase
MKHIETLEMLRIWHDNIKRIQIANADAASFFSRGNLLLGIPTIIVTATVGASAVTEILKDHKVILALLGLLATILAGLQAFLNFGDRSAKHKNTANEYGCLKRNVQKFLALPPSSDYVFEQKLDEVQKTYDDLMRISPHVPIWIWRRAMQDIPLAKYPWKPLTKENETASTSRMEQVSILRDNALDNVRLLLLMGPTGAGKSTLLRALEECDRRFQYIAPVTTRKLRPGETDRVSVSETELQRLLQNGEILAVNEFFSTKYGTPLAPILNAFDQGKFPIVEWPISRLSVMEEAFSERLFRVYVRPPSVRHIAERLMDKDNYDRRLEAAKDELVRLEAHEYDNKIDLLVTSNDGEVADCAKTIHKQYLRES